MYTDVSLKLRNKIRYELKILKNVSDEYYDHFGVLSFNENEEDLYEECKEWLNVIETYFKTSYDAYRIERIGRFKHLRPYEMNAFNAKFQVMDYDKISWRDWFVDDADQDGDLLGDIGKIINDRFKAKHKDRYASF